MIRRRAPRRGAHLILTGVLASAATGVWAATGAAPDTVPGPAPRVEARSADLMAVGIVHGTRMDIHVSRLLDNAPVRDAVLTVMLRGVLHPTTAEADGGYTLQTRDLELPGSAAVIFQTAVGEVHEELKGSLQVAQPAGKPDEDKNSARQLGWWVLNFAVCIGFLMLLSRRRKAAAARGD